MQIREIPVAYSIGSQTPEGPTSPTPSPQSLSQKVRQLTAAINRPLEAQRLRNTYQIIASQIRAGTFTSKSQVVSATRQIVESLFAGDQSGVWSGWLVSVEQEVRRVEQQGGMDTLLSMADIWDQIAAGLGSASAEQQRLDPDQRKELLQLIIRIILMIISGAGANHE